MLQILTLLKGDPVRAPCAHFVDHISSGKSSRATNMKERMFKHHFEQR